MLGTGILLLGVLVAGAGLMISSSEKSLERLDSCDLSKRPYTKKALKTFGIDVLELTEDERMAVLSRLDYQVKLFAEEKSFKYIWD